MQQHYDTVFCSDVYTENFLKTVFFSQAILDVDEVGYKMYNKNIVSGVRELSVREQNACHDKKCMCLGVCVCVCVCVDASAFFYTYHINVLTDTSIRISWKKKKVV